MKEVAIIGAGRLGTSLAAALRKKGYQIKVIADCFLAQAKESQKIIGQGKALMDNVLAARQSKIIFLCVPDEEIHRIVKELDHSHLSWKGKIIFHSSGLLNSEILGPLKARGASVASFHPIQSFSQKTTPARVFSGTYIGLEGEKKALSLAQKIVSDLGSRPLLLHPDQKALYHAACSIASNFLVVLLDIALKLFKQIGLEEKKAFSIILPLVEGTLHNVKQFNINASLTGPIIRGDIKSVEQHLQALKKFPLFYEIYLKLGSQALQIAKRQKLPPQKIKALKKLLEGK